MNATNLLNHLSIPGSLCCEPVIGDHVGRTAITKVRVEVARVQCIDLGREGEKDAVIGRGRRRGRGAKERRKG